MILWRQIFRQISSAYYFRPSVTYAFVDRPGGDRFYGSALGGVDVGPAGGFAPGHVYRCLTSITDVRIGPFDIFMGLDTPGAFWPRTDQTFLQAFFPDWHGLPVYDNLLQYVWLNLPELWDWSQIPVLHFQYEKPWDPANPRAGRLAPLIALWRPFHSGEGIPDDLASLPRP